MRGLGELKTFPPKSWKHPTPQRRLNAPYPTLSLGGHVIIHRPDLEHEVHTQEVTKARPYAMSLVLVYLLQQVEHGSTEAESRSAARCGLGGT